MKTHNFLSSTKLSILLFAFILLFNGCKKRPFDYRNKYCGNWELYSVRVTSHYNRLLGWWHDSLKTKVSGRVFYNKSDKHYQVRIGVGYERLYEIDKKGNLTTTEGSGHFLNTNNFEYTQSTTFTMTGVRQ